MWIRGMQPYADALHNGIQRRYTVAVWNTAGVRQGTFVTGAVEALDFQGRWIRVTCEGDLHNSYQTSVILGRILLARL